MPRQSLPRGRATARTPPGRVNRTRVTSKWAIRINRNLIGSRALALSERSASLHSSSGFRQNYQFATHALLVFELGAMKRFFGPARSKSTAKIRNGEKFPNSSEICQTTLSPVAFQSPKRQTRRVFGT